MTTASPPAILKKILDHKRIEVASRQQHISLQELKEKIKNMPPCRGFVDAISKLVANDKPAVIAEVKKASPSKGVIRANFDPEAIAISYEKNGAACLSVLTDEEFFQGCDDYLLTARAAVSIPVLRKDFIIDEYQVYETRAMGADCLLLIAAAFRDQPHKLEALNRLAQKIGLDVLIEVHDVEELEMILPFGNILVGINNRDLNTFETSLDTTFDLLSHIIDERIVVTESGIHCSDDVAAMRGHSVNAFLVGEAFMRKPDPGAALRDLFS